MKCSLVSLSVLVLLGGALAAKTVLRLALPTRTTRRPRLLCHCKQLENHSWQGWCARIGEWALSFPPIAGKSTPVAKNV